MVVTLNLLRTGPNHGEDSWQADWAAAGGRMVLESTYNHPTVQAMDVTTQGYFTYMREQGPLYRGAPPLPFDAQVREVFAPFFYDANAGKITAQEALDGSAAAETEMVKLEYEL